MNLEGYFSETGMKKKVFASKIGVVPAMIGRWLTGENIPTLENAIRIKQETRGKVTPDDLYNYYILKNGQRNEPSRALD